MKIKESDLAKQLIDYLCYTGYDIYQEVNSPVGSTDIVIKDPVFIWSIEVKLSFNFTVLAQAEVNLRYYNYSSIFVQYPNSGSKNWNFGIKLCKMLGIGVFVFDNTYKRVSERIKPRLQRKALTSKIVLFSDKKDYAEAGNNNGKRWTPFKETVQELEKFVRKNPGCKMRDALGYIKHHYSSISSAHNSLARLINCGVIDNISVDCGKLNLVENAVK